LISLKFLAFPEKSTFFRYMKRPVRGWVLSISYQRFDKLDGSRNLAIHSRF
jgi:hypothetical protein